MSNRAESRELLAEAERALTENDSLRAEQALRQATDLDAHDDESPLMLAMLAHRRGGFVEAVEWALESLRRRPFQPAAMNLLAVSCLETDRPRLAVGLLRRTLRMAPGLTQARENLELARQREREPRGKATTSGRFPEREVRRWIRPGRPRLTVCVVRDDPEQDGAASSGSVGGLADEVVVIDAPGEADPWNEAVRRATGDWLLLLRADERVEPSALPLLRAALRNRGALWHTLELWRPDARRGYRAVRLVRNAPGLRVTGTHAPDVTDASAALAERWGLRGHDAPVRVRAAAPSRRAPGERSGDPGMRIECARALLEGGDASGALAEVRPLRMARTHPPAVRHVVAVEPPLVLEAAALARLGRHGELRELLAWFHERFEPSEESLYLEALAERAGGRPERCLALLEQAIADSRRPSCMAPLAEVAGSVLPNLIGALQLELGNCEGARRAFGLAAEREPHNLESRLGLLGVRVAAGELDGVLQELEQLVADAGDDPKVWLAGDILLSRIPRMAAISLNWIEEAGRRFPDDEEIRLRLGRTRLRFGQSTSALGLLERDDAGRFAACLASGSELPDIESDRREALAQELLGWFEAWLTAGTIEALDRALVDIARAEDALPGIAGRTACWLGSIGQHEAARRVQERVGC